jgi:integrase-like protein
VLPFFVELDPDQRVVFAGAISSGLRKGELCGLLKKDLDVPRRLVVARHSYAQPFPKSKKQRVVRIPEEFVSFYDYALQAYPGAWLFPHLDGTMREKTWQPEDILRRALKRAGIVTGYTHVCRRSTCRYSEERRDAEIRPCPRCGYKLWPKGNVRHIRFHDLRHTYASVLLMFGANLTSVQKLLGHSDPKITERRYGHMLPDFMKSEVDRLRFGLDRLAPALPGGGAAASKSGGDSQEFAAVGGGLGTPVVRNGRSPQKEAGIPEADALEIPAVLLAGSTGLEPVASGVTGRRYNRLN